MTVGERIIQARSARNISRPQLAAMTGIPYPTLAGLENGNQRGSTRLADIAAVLRVRLHWLRTGRGPREDEADEEWRDITSYGQEAAAGAGSNPDEYAETDGLKFKRAALQKNGLSTHRLAIFQARGDSMEPRIRSGDDLLFDLDDTVPRDGSIFVVVHDGLYLVKRLEKYGDHWFLTSDNTSDPQWRKPIAVRIGDDVEILGRVRWIGSWEN